MSRTPYIGIVVVVLAVALTGCGSRDSAAPAGAPAGPPVLNTVSVDTVLDAIKKAKLPALNAHDTTASTCPEAGCLQATATDTVSILKFPSTGRAEIYAAAVPDMLQIEDIVVVYAPTLTSEQKAAYGQAVKNAMR